MNGKTAFALVMTTVVAAYMIAISASQTRDLAAYHPKPFHTPVCCMEQQGDRP